MVLSPQRSRRAMDTRFHAADFFFMIAPRRECSYAKEGRAESESVNPEDEPMGIETALSRKFLSVCKVLCSQGGSDRSKRADSVCLFLSGDSQRKSPRLSSLGASQSDCRPQRRNKGTEHFSEWCPCTYFESGWSSPAWRRFRRRLGRPELDASTSCPGQDERVAIFTGLFHPLLDAKKAECFVARC